ncbi:hypothetical protein AXF42_Ash000450 [Apostasia shenzhenica]|uniref:Uncharacterized protein n=1 Tax=Apostasia shenzhenica TaxID=1088818 RepID=A0A2I0AGH3_9ASPA|nr:hypothetical protein AXF42_Ash000450 [Apostasia shenzhenica]
MAEEIEALGTTPCLRAKWHLKEREEKSVYVCQMRVACDASESSGRHVVVRGVSLDSSLARYELKTRSRRDTPNSSRQAEQRRARMQFRLGEFYRTKDLPPSQNEDHAVKAAPFPSRAVHVRHVLHLHLLIVLPCPVLCFCLYN